MSKIMGSEIRKENKRKVARFILHNRETSNAEICSALGLSMPTVLQNVQELMEEEIVTEAGHYQSTGGRKAKRLAISGDFRYSIGIDITKHHLSFVLLNLQGDILKKQRCKSIFENSFEYYAMIKETLQQFIISSEICEKKILGVGISLPGIIEPGKEILIHSHILGLHNISLKTLSNFIPFEVCFENDANSAAMAEMKYKEGNAIYLSLSNTVGGSIYFHNEIYPGDCYKSAEFGHMILQPKGKKCYCGKEGCADAYCAAKVLSEHTEDNLEKFFSRLEDGDEVITNVWDGYLDYLAVLISNLRMAFDCDIILGGYVGAHIERYMVLLSRKVLKYNLFEDDVSYIKPCKYHDEAAAMGIAMKFIDNYFYNI